MSAIEKINQVEGFDPAQYVVDYTDLTTGETRKRLPVMAQMAWFRLKYPEGRIAVQVSPGKDCFVATARVRGYGFPELPRREAVRFAQGMGTDCGSRDCSAKCRFWPAILHGRGRVPG